MNKKGFILLGILFPNLLLAGADSWKKVATISFGPAWYNVGKTQTIYLQPEFANTYTATRIQRMLTSEELFLSLQKQLVVKSLLGQLGLAVATTSHAQLQGNVWELADPAFDNFTYQYNIRHTRVAVKGKLLSTKLSETILPYLSASLGVAFNKSYSFNLAPKIFEAIPTQTFHGNSQTTFTYTLGGGLQKILNQHWQAGLGYELADWGKSSLSRASGQTLGNGLILNHLYTNQLQFSLSYVS